MSIWGHLFTRAANALLDWLEAAWHDAHAAAAGGRSNLQTERPAGSTSQASPPKAL